MLKRIQQYQSLICAEQIIHFCKYFAKLGKYREEGVNIFSMVTWEVMVFGFQFDVVNFLFFPFLHSRSCLGVAWVFILFCFLNRWFALHKGQFTQVDTCPFFSMAYCVVVKLAEKKEGTSIRITFLFEKKTLIIYGSRWFLTSIARYNCMVCQVFNIIIYSQSIFFIWEK